MNNAISDHLSKLVGGVKSMAGYLQTQLDAYYEQIQNSSLFSNYSRIVPIIHWQKKIKSANVITTEKEAQILWFKKCENTK